MLIVCSGPDAYSARQKARELQSAFREKYDPAGYSTEVLSEPSLQDLLNRLSAPSFFATKRFLRADGLLDSLKIAEVRTLTARLEADKDQTIVLSVEEESPNEKVLTECKKAPFFHYTHLLPQGASFAAWCAKQAERIGASMKDAQEVTRACEGDTWLAVQELSKRAANPASRIVPIGSEDISVFEVVDARILQRAGWRDVMAHADVDQLAITLAAQARSLVRIQHGETAGIHPFLVKKFSRANIQYGNEAFLDAARAIVASRTGLSSSSETSCLI
jgi:hypothetical protein